MRRCVCVLVLGFVNLYAGLVSKFPHSGYMPSNVQHDRVISVDESHVDAILGKVKRFDSSNYEIYGVQSLGLFLLDAKPDWIKDLLRANQEWEGYMAL